MSTIKSEEMKKLFNRVYFDKMEANDPQEIKAVCEKVFGDGGKTSDPSLLHQFNNLVVEMADEVAKPRVTELIGLLANVDRQQRGNVKIIKTPAKIRAKVFWAANGSGVDLIRVAGMKQVPAVPQTFTTGFYYEPLDLVTDSVNSFNQLIEDLANAKVRLYMANIGKLTAAGITAGKIPSGNVIDGSNTSIADYNKLASRLSRYGGRPVFVADPIMIDDLAFKQVTDPTMGKVITEAYKGELLDSLNITRIGRTTAVNLVNPFVDEAGTRVELNVQEGYMFAGETGRKPFEVVEYGGMRQMTEFDIEDERIKMKIAQDAAIILVYGEILGYDKDDTLSLDSSVGGGLTITGDINITGNMAIAGDMVVSGDVTVPEEPNPEG